MKNFFTFRKSLVTEGVKDLKNYKDRGNFFKKLVNEIDSET